MRTDGVHHMPTRCGRKLGVGVLTNGQWSPMEPSQAMGGHMALAIYTVMLAITVPTPPPR